MKNHDREVMFQVVTGREPYTVIDLNTNGYTWHTEKLDAYKMCAVILALGHNYRLEVR